MLLFNTKTKGLVDIVPIHFSGGFLFKMFSENIYIVLTGGLQIRGVSQ